MRKCSSSTFTTSALRSSSPPSSTSPSSLHSVRSLPSFPQTLLTLCSPDPPLDLPLVTVALFGHLCDLLCFFISHHTFRSKYYVLSTDIAAAVGRLFATKNKHLHLAAIRFLRACIGRGDEFYNRFLMKSDLFGAVVRQAARERGRDNLVTSACLEFVEFVRTVSSSFPSFSYPYSFGLWVSHWKLTGAGNRASK